MAECYRLLLTEEFEEWLDCQNPRSRYQIDARLARLRLDSHFGTNKSVSNTEKGSLKNKIWELKFNNGIRIYYAIIPENNILLLLGGNKNGQTKDIERAKKLFVSKTKAKGKKSG